MRVFLASIPLDGRTIAVVTFLTASTLSFAEAEAVLADVMRGLLSAIR